MFNRDKKYKVQGKVTGMDTLPIQEAVITVHLQRIRTLIPLAEGRTSAEGNYVLEYSLPDQLPGRAFIIVEAKDSRTGLTVTSSPTEAQPALVIDLAAEPKDDSEFAVLYNNIRQLLDRLPLADLTENTEHQDITYLARELSTNTEQIMRAVVAERLSASFRVDAAVFYAFLRQEIPATLPQPLLDASQQFTLIVPLVHNIASLIFALSPDLQQQTLINAVAQNIIGVAYGKQIPAIVSQLQAHQVTDLLTQPYLTGDTSLSQILGLTGLSTDKQQAFSLALATNTGSISDFWTTLSDGQHGFTTAEATGIQNSLTISSFTGNYLPMSQALLKQVGTAPIQSLAKLTLADWQQLVNQTGAPTADTTPTTPAGAVSTNPSTTIPGAASVTTDTQTYARTLYTSFTQNFPTIALSSRIAQLVPQEQRAPLNQFFQNNPDLELVTDNLTAYFSANSRTAFSGIDTKDQPVVTASLRTFQRVLRLSTDPDTAQQLVSTGLSSATKIATLGKQQFALQASTAGISDTAIDEIYETASYRYASLVTTYMQNNIDSIGVLPKMVGQLPTFNIPAQQAAQRDQSLATLFGSLDYCETDDCSSVLSPAAYLCDLLLWLRNHPQGSKTALDLLDERRPDIRNLLLNCPNTNTELPYIDLVNELLADKISPAADPNSTLNPTWKQTSGDLTAGQLRAAPEYFNQDAYTILFNASYPQTLPYSTGLDELRTCLLQFNLPLWQLRQALLPAGATVDRLAAVAAERLGLTVRAENMITTPDFITAAQAWNTTDFTNGANGLARVPAFLQTTGLTYAQLQQLLTVKWVLGGLNIVITGISDTCDTTAQALSPASPLDSNFLDRAHRFLRLWRATGSKMWELDLLLTAPAIGNNVLDQTALVNLQSFWQLQQATNLSVTQLLTFYQNMDTAAHLDDNGTTISSLYSQVFLNPTVTWIAPDADLVNLPAGGPIGNPSLSDHVKAIQPALAVTAADAATLFMLTDGQLTLANLSLLYRVNGLALAAKLSIPNLLTIAGLLTPGAATPAASIPPLLTNPTATLAFLKQATDLRQSALSQDAIQYLLTPPAADGTWSTISQMTPANIITTLTAIQQNIIQLQATGNGDLDGNVIATAAANACPAGTAPLANDVAALLLRQLQVPGTGKTLLQVLEDSALVNGAPAITQAAFPNQFTAIQLYDKVALLVRMLRLVATDSSWLLANAAIYGGLNLQQLPVTTAQPAIPLPSLLTTLLLIKLARLFTAAPATAATQSLYDLILNVSTGALPDTASVQSALAAITSWPLADIEAFTPALNLTYPASFTLPAVYDSLRTLTKMSAAVAGTGPTVSAASTTLTVAAAAADTTLTVASAIGFPAPPFYISLGAEIILVTALGGSDNTAWTVQRGQSGTSAAAAAVGAVVSPTYGAQIISWGSLPADEISAENLAASALGVLKARQTTDDNWLTLAPTMMDPIRERRSAALQAYLTGLRDVGGKLLYPDTNALFDYFLIDVQMSSCQVTSRIVQAYIAIQIFVERCLMNLETTAWDSAQPGVIVDITKDDTWSQWEWMSRYRIWEANREVFLFPENWLIESQRPDRTEIYQQLEQEVRQGQSTTDYLETVVLNYIDRLDGLSHLLVTGTCLDPDTGIIYVIARTSAEPPTFYMRTLEDGAWTGWVKLPLDIKAHQAIPAIYRGRICVFWIDVKVSNEPNQPLTPPQESSSAPSQRKDSYTTIGVNFSIYRNGGWAPVQATKSKLFDKPIFDSTKQSTDVRTVEALYTLKAVTQTTAAGTGAVINLDLFRLGSYQVNSLNFPFFPLPTVNVGEYHLNEFVVGVNEQSAVHIGRAVFEGRFSDLELRNMIVPGGIPFGDTAWIAMDLLTHAKKTYGPDAQGLVPLAIPDASLHVDSGLSPEEGALCGFPDAAGLALTGVLSFSETLLLEQNHGALLQKMIFPTRLIGPSTDLNFDPGTYFFYQDSRRGYYVETTKYYTSKVSNTGRRGGIAFRPYELLYKFHPFYHPFTRLFWDQLAGGGFDLLYDPALQLAPDSVDPSYPDLFNFTQSYQPTWRVTHDLADDSTHLAAGINNVQTQITVTQDIWIPIANFIVTIGSEQLLVTGVSGARRTTWTVVRGHAGTTRAVAAAGALVTPVTAAQDRQFLDFSPGGSFAVYNWELFYHIPLYIAQLLSQNQQFEDAQKWFHYIFNPQQQSNDPLPQRFWIPKPLHDLTSADIAQERINNLLLAVNEKNAAAVAQINRWRQDPFNPFVLADLRPVAYMKSTVMSYLDNIIAWADNLFASESREALSEATLLYVIAAEILGPKPAAVPPPQHADMSYAQLEPDLDAFANAMVEIENVISPVISFGPNIRGPRPIFMPHTFYFKIPPNDKLLGYWDTVADRLYKLRHCQSITGAPLQLALFDAPIDPGLLIAAQAAGVDLSSVLSNATASLPNYRFTALYTQALDFVNALRAYGTALQGALEKSDGGAFTLLQQTLQQQLLVDGNDILDWQIQQQQQTIENLTQGLNLAQAKYDFNSSQKTNEAEVLATILHTESSVIKIVSAATKMVGSVAAVLPNFTAGAAGFGGSPVATVNDGGVHAAVAAHSAADSNDTVAAIMDAAATLITTINGYVRRQDTWDENAKEALIQVDQANAQIAGAQIALQINQQNKVLHQEQIDNLQKQIDFLNAKFTNDDLYDWMINSLSATYFQSYQLAYQLCREVERCYQFEMGITDSSFIQFGYWDSLHKGLLAGETLNHDLRRLQASYLQQNARRYEMSRFVSLSTLSPASLQQLLITGACDFDLSESLFDNDYPGHYNRRLTRMSVTVVYPSPGKFDNIKATLTMVANKVRVKTDIGSGYAEDPIGSDSRFIYSYAANAQKIALGNGQDDPGLFITAIASNIADQRYLPFENAGVISSWHFEMPQLNNEVDLSTVGDIVLHLYYTAMDGGTAFEQTVQANNLANAPTSGIKAFSAQNDFAAPSATIANPYPQTPWQLFLATVAAPANQLLTLAIAPAKFPAWTRGKTISVISITLLTVNWTPGNFVIVPQAPLPATPLTTTPVPGSSEPAIGSVTINMPPNTPLGTWVFEIQLQGAADFRSLTKNLIGDVLLLVDYTVS